MAEFTSIISLVIAYFLGAIPSAVWVCRWLHGTDIREHGSKNAGLTNVFRVYGWRAAVPVLVIDLSKGFLAPWIALQIVGDGDSAAQVWIPLLAGVLAIAGHSFTVFAGFRGGKGVLTSLGVFLCFAPVEGLLAFAVWCAFAFTTRYVSLASIMACVTLGTLMTLSWVKGDIRWNLLLLGWFASLFVIIKHRTNMVRLLNGTENRFGAKKPEETESEETPVEAVENKEESEEKEG